MTKINKILLAMAGDSRESNLLKESISIRDQLDANIDIVHVNPKYAGDMSMMMDSIKMVTDKDIMRQIEDYGQMESFSLALESQPIMVFHPHLETIISRDHIYW